MSRTRTETAVTIDRAWAAPDGERHTIDVVLPQTASDFMVTDYDDAETLYIVENGLLEEYDEQKRNFVLCGERNNKEK